MADGKVTVDTSLNNKGFEAGLKAITGKMGGLAKTVGKLSLTMVAAFGTAAVAISKQSADAYADWEQLCGGVETLFKGAADKVRQYAEDAFFTAGMSANEYMETVTGVSASLISSLGGDTAKAADIANMAITDMADNANKMGTPLENVKTAYAGFAKQQYMLLDNLKLGYGGTKTEMQRLLKDAEAFSGVKYDINNLGDVYSAIHAIQEKMGITGATAAEAEKTITGSANMTKAAWKNVLTAIAGGGDLDKAINNLVYSVSKYFENIVPVVQRSISGIGQLIEKVAPALVQTVASSLIAAIPSLLNAIYQMIIGLAKGIYQGIIALFSGGSFSGTITKQLNNVSSGFSGAATGAENLAEETEKAGKAAKKSLAGFDELNVLADKSGGSGDPNGSISFGGAATSASTNISVDGEVTETVTPVMQIILEKIRQMFEPFKNINLNAISNSFIKLKDSLYLFASEVFTGLEWGWYNILVPLAKWSIEEAAPASVEALAATIDAVTETLRTLREGFIECWDELMPIFSWIGDTVLVVFSDLKDIGDGVAKKWKENSGKLKKTFQNLGGVIEKLWVVIGPILTFIRDAISTVTVGLPLNELQHIFDILFAISEILAGIFSLDPKQILNGLVSAITAETEYAEAQTKAFANAVGIDLDQIDAYVKKTMQKVGQWFSDAWSKIVETWQTVASWFNDTVIVPLKEFWSPIGDWFGELFGSIEQTLSDAFHNISVIAEGCWVIIKYVWGLAGSWFNETFIQPLVSFFENAWSTISARASEAWGKIKEIFSPITSWFNEKLIEPLKDKFSELWSGFRDKAMEAWAKVKDAFSDTAKWGKDILNELIGSLNSGLSKIFSGINSGLDKLKSLKVGDAQPFANIKTISVPQIPYLAKGAVLPANKPFLAMVGDQRHGTNIEAPLSTIQEAVALVMQDYAASNLAGHEATVAVLREILEAVLGISIGDDVIANAVGHYQSRMAVVRGGQL